MNNNMFAIKNVINSINISCTKLHKRFRIHYGLNLEMAGRVNSVRCFVSIMLKFNAFSNANTVERQHTRLPKSNQIYCLLFEIFVSKLLFNDFEQS